MRTELWEQKAAMFAPYSGAGFSAGDVASLTGMTYPTVRRYADKFGFEFCRFPDTPEQEGKRAAAEREMVSRLTEVALQGKSRREAAKALGISYQTVVKYGLRHPIPFIHEKADRKAQQRAEAMASMYRQGKTLAEIGELHGLTRERVRQLIAKHCGLTAADGGQSTIVQRKREVSIAKKDGLSIQKYGCTHSEYLSLMRMGTAQVRSGGSRSRSPTGAFISQKRNAMSRGIEWNLKLWDWWQIWQQSGKWEERGRGRGKYVMCRFGDVGAYEAGNVYIATCEHNGSFQPNNPYRNDHPDHEEAINAIRHKLNRRGHRRSSTRDLPVGVYEHNGRFRAQVCIHRKIRYLGTFSSAVEARAAIDAALAEHSLRAAA